MATYAEQEIESVLAFRERVGRILEAAGIMVHDNGMMISGSVFAEIAVEDGATGNTFDIRIDLSKLA